MVYVLLADGFEEIEALAPVDFLRRSGVPVITVSLAGTKACGAHGIEVIADKNVKDVDFSTATMILLPGGMPGTMHLDEFPQMTEILSIVYGNGGYLAAICAAPMVLGKRGYLNGKKAICYPGFEEYLFGAEISQSPVVQDGRIITARSAGVAWDFGYVLSRILAGNDVCETVRKSLFLPPFGV